MIAWPAQAVAKGWQRAVRVLPPSCATAELLGLSQALEPCGRCAAAARRKRRFRCHPGGTPLLSVRRSGKEPRERPAT